MLFVIILLVFFSFILSLILGLSIGVAFMLTWLFPNIPFATGALIGAISSSFSIYFLVRLVVFIMEREPIDLDGEFSEDIEEESTDYIILPRIVPPGKRKKRPKRKR